VFGTNIVEQTGKSNEEIEISSDVLQKIIIVAKTCGHRELRERGK
jgi:hypothetical protein